MGVFDNAIWQNLYKSFFGGTTPQLPDPQQILPSPQSTPSSSSTSQPVKTTIDAVDYRAFEQIFNTEFQQNILNGYYQPAYHFRLFVVSDIDILDQAGGVVSTKDLGQKLNDNTIKQITIAESGVTGYNIKDVEIITKASQNPVSREQSVATVSMTITEPLGTTFLDGLFTGFPMLGIFDYTKMHFYLELTFTGYKEDGTYAGRPIADSHWLNGGYWLSRLTMTTIETKITEGGATYTLKLVPPESSAVLDEKNKITHGAQTVTVESSNGTLYALFADYVKQTNTAWKKMYSLSKDGSSPVVFGGIYLYPMESGPNKDADVGKFKLKPNQPDKSRPNMLKLDGGQHGNVIATLPPGMSTNEFITSAIGATEEGQRMWKDTTNLEVTSDDKTHVNQRHFRQVTLFGIETDIKYIKAETVTGQYQKSYTIHVRPYQNSQSVVLDRIQANDAKDPAVQKKMIQALLDANLIKKRYDYIFTGMNTEILEHNIDFNFAFNNITARTAGARLGFSNESVNAIFNDIQKNELVSGSVALTTDLYTIDQNLKEAKKDFDATIDNIFQKEASYMYNSFQEAQNARDAAKELLNQQTNQAYLAAAAAAQTMTDLANQPVNLPSQPRLASLASGQLDHSFYIEDELSIFNQNPGSAAKDLRIPQSFWQNYFNTNDFSGTGFTGQYMADQSIIGAIMAQIYGSSQTGSFANIDLTIRGDPWWLGQTNLDRQILMRAGIAPSQSLGTVPNTGMNPGIQPNAGKAIPTDPKGLPNYLTGKQVIYMYYQYPLQQGDDFKPVLTPSQSLNGLYEIHTVTHTFSDGAFKQRLQGNLLSLIDVFRAMRAPNTIGSGGAVTGGIVNA